MFSINYLSKTQPCEVPKDTYLKCIWSSLNEGDLSKDRCDKQQENYYKCLKKNKELQKGCVKQ